LGRERGSLFPPEKPCIMRVYTERLSRKGVIDKNASAPNWSKYKDMRDEYGKAQLATV